MNIRTLVSRCKHAMIACAFAVVISFAAPSTYAQSSDATLPSWRQQVTTQAYERRTQRAQTTELRLSSLIQRVEDARARYDEIQRVDTLLWYILQLAQDDLDELTTNTSSSSSSEQAESVLTPQWSTPSSQNNSTTTLDTTTFIEDQESIVWSDSTVLVDLFELNARLESFEIEQFEVTCQDVDLIDRVHIIDENWVVLWSSSLSGWSARINTDYTQERWTQDYYLAVTSVAFGATSSQLVYWDVTCTTQLTEATWVSSSSDYGPISLWTTQFSVQPVVVSEFSFVDQYAWYRLQEEISTWTNSTLALFQLSTDETDAVDSRNRDEEGFLNTLTFTVSWAQQSDFSSVVRLQRLDRSTSDFVVWTWEDTDTIVFDLRGSPEWVRRLDPGTNAWFRITWTTTRTSWSIRFVVEDLQNWFIEYTANDTSEDYTRILPTQYNYVESPAVRIE